MGRIGALDGMRGVLATVVAMYHLLERALFPGAYVAVDMFFIMSGFILCHAYIPKLAQHTLSSFFWRRFARLFPVYAVTGLVLVPVAVLGFPLEESYTSSHPSIYSYQGFLSYMGAFQAFVPGYYWNTPGWSVSGELWLSLGVFLLLPWVLRKDTGGWLPICVALGLYALTVGDNGSLSIIKDRVGGVVSGATLRPICGFLMGIGVYKLVCHGGPRFDIPKSLLRVGEIMLLLLCLGLPAVIGRSELDLIVVASFTILMASIVHFGDKLVTTRVLMWRPILYLGSVSYSIYLWHTVIKHFFFRGVRDGWLEIGILETAAYLVIVVAVSHLSYKLIELPGQNWINRNSTAGLMKSRRSDVQSVAAR